ncbi:MAG TPA: glutamate-1-semialdehyde 2,1-aminomutase [Gemmatirosa sp.]|nr:glutamate-1-semialdehyde 2,1-aminomutase [Gemmatirosa sp.]
MATQTTPELQHPTRDTSRSHALLERARTLFPGGVNSPVRAFGGVGGEPFFVERGEGARIWDADGNAYLDYVLSWGPLVLGHAPRVVLDAVQETMRRGTSFGIPTELETRLGEAIRARMPHVEMLRFVSSGTEATMSAVRLARAATGRDAILKFDGCYHGHADSFLVRAGSGVATLGLPNSPGVPSALAELTLTATFNAVDEVEAIGAAEGHRLAAIIVEPVVGNAGYIPPEPGFLEALRRVCDRTGALLVFDEVMTGFRVAFGGATEAFGVTPDLVTLGKVVGGGLPVAAYGGRAALMQQVAPVGRMYQAGTLSGNPLAMAGGLATLEALTRDVHDGIVRRTAALVSGMRAIAARHGVPFTAGHTGSMWGFFFHAGPVRSFAEAREGDVALFRRFFHAALDRGVYLAPSAFEAGFMSAAHGDAEVAETLDRLDGALGAALEAGAGA